MAGGGSHEPMTTEAVRGQSSIAVDQADDLSAVVGELVDVVEDLRQENEELRDRVEQLEDDLSQEREERTLDVAEDRKRITDVEDRVEDLEAGDGPQGADGEDRPTDRPERPQTPLEQTAGLPQEMVDKETANVRRAVFVARDVMDYTRSVPAGRVIMSSELRKVLKAGTDCRGHSQTVDRVMTLLDELGGDDVRIVERRGERRVVFSEEISSRLDRLGSASNPRSHGVVAGGTV